MARVTRSMLRNGPQSSSNAPSTSNAASSSSAPKHQFVDRLPKSTRKAKKPAVVDDDDSLMEDVRVQADAHAKRKRYFRQLMQKNTQEQDEQEEEEEEEAAAGQPQITQQQQRAASTEPAEQGERQPTALQNIADSFPNWFPWKTCLVLLIWLVIFNVLATIPRVEDTALQALCLKDSYRAGSAEIGVEMLGRDFCEPIYRPEDRDSKIDNVIEAIDALKKLKKMIPRRQHDGQKNSYYEVAELKEQVDEMIHEVNHRQPALVKLSGNSPYDSLVHASDDLEQKSRGFEAAAVGSVMEMEKALDRLIADANTIVFGWKRKTQGIVGRLRSYASILLIPSWAPTSRLRRSLRTFALENRVDAEQDLVRATRFRDSLNVFLKSYEGAKTALNVHVNLEKGRCKRLFDEGRAGASFLIRWWAWCTNARQKTMEERCAEETIEENCCTASLAKLQQRLKESGNHALKLKPWADKYEEAWQQYVSNTLPVAVPFAPQLRPVIEAMEDVAKLNEAVGKS